MRQIHFLKILGLCSVIILSFFCTDIYAKKNILVGSWGLNEGEGTFIYDSSEYENHGQNYSAVWQSGFEGASLKFNGKKSYILIPHSDSLLLNDELTISAWINPDEIKNQYIVYKDLISGEESRRGGGVYYSLEMHSGKIRVVLIDENKQEHIAYGSKPVSSNEWQHIAVTWDGEVIKVFYDGNLIGENIFSGKIFRGSEGEVLIGRYRKNYFNGSIDQVKIYRNALSENDIAGLYSHERQFYMNPLLMRTVAGNKLYKYTNDKGWHRFETNITQDWDYFFPDVYQESENVTALMNIIGVPMTPTSDDAEIWDRAGKIWNWLRENQLKVDDPNYQAAKDYHLNFLAVNDSWISVDGFASMFLEFDGFWWGTCMSRAQIFTSLLYKAGIPFNKTCVLTSDHPSPDIYQHMYTGLNVFDSWLYFDATDMFFEFPSISIPHSIPIPLPTVADYRYPYSVLSAEDAVAHVPKVLYHLNEINPVYFFPYENDFTESVFIGRGITVHFSDIITPGDTNVEKDFVATAPENYTFVPPGEVYDLSSTVEYSGEQTVSITYNESFDKNLEPELKMVVFDETTGQWDDVTVYRNPVSNTIYGMTAPNGRIAIIRPLN